ncbi:TetR/AcrR family transcriptional regulator [Dermatobacter hominis]|uniref:TetR/AcrR family transcriptional regulator n=1 Tax=Dermatobacter hominis TaxID=2884263 RepID=UPI001D10EACF|nr:TetR/AcrR family transcriptional regulator [Dermatobacter hominis]UDY36615.1 TetR/AcrR family transcriptional regulator [Dermatobacter hominis]
MAESSARPRGRAAEAQRNDRLVLEAARDLVATEGPGVSVAAIADRAGVGMGSLYRRYRSKTELLQRLCVMAMDEAIAAAEQGLAEPDAWTGLAHYVRRCVEFRSGSLGSLAGAIPTTREMWDTAARGRGMVDLLVARAHNAGALRADVTAIDVAHLVQLFAPSLPVADPEEAGNARDRLLAIALDGLRPGSAESLPGRAPDPAAYGAAWAAAAEPD